MWPSTWWRLWHFAYHIAEHHETRVPDQFYTWGWDKAGTANYLPLTGLKLRKKKTAKRMSSATLLYGCANNYRYLRRFNYSAHNQLDYYAQQQNFISHLAPQLLDHLVVRLYPMDWGWDRKERWQRSILI